MRQVLGYHHVSLSVSDIGKSAAWYRDVLGFSIETEFEGDGFRRARLRAPGSGLTLALTSHHQESAETFDERRPGIDHIAFNVGSVEDVRDFNRRFEELGVVHSDVKEGSSGTAIVTLRDPDNIQLEVFGGP
jgi:catechol 2,3-dioxygenase-like lactoylglutathione lyase family enzyme